MLVILIEDQILTPQQVCQSCLMANSSGLPRWHQGQLRCGHAVREITERQPQQYECMMGFRVVNVE